MRCGSASRRTTVHDETYETNARVASALRPPPDVEPGEKARVLVAVAAERERIRGQRVRTARRWKVTGAVGGVAAAAALVAAVWLSGAGGNAPATAVTPSATRPATGPTPSVAPVDARLA